MPLLIVRGWLIGAFRSVPISLLPVIVAIVIPWIAGVVFGLNPLGDEGRVLPTTLTTSITGKQYIHGITIPGRVIGLPAIIVLSIGTGVVSPYSLLEQMGLMALGVLLLFASVQLAPAVGMRFPRFSAIDVGQSREVVPPSLTAMVVHSLITLGLGAVAAASLLAPSGVQTVFQLLVGGLVPFLFELVADAELSIATIPARWFQSFGAAIGGLPTAWIRIGGFGGLVVIAIAIADRSCRYASNKFERYTVE